MRDDDGAANRFWRRGAAARWLAALALLAGCGASTRSVPDGGDAIADVGLSCQLPNGARCAAGTSCPAGDGCNQCSCPVGGGDAQCTLAFCVPDDAGPRQCSSTAPCASGQVCVYTPGCGPGRCDAPVMCDVAYQVCGCDGLTHVVECQATLPVAHLGPCETPDAGPRACTASAQCNRGEFCYFDVGACGAPGHCDPSFECFAAVPFCGCDGVEFDSCPGRAERPAVSMGHCPATPDAGTCSGCSLGRGGAYCAGPADGACDNDCCSGWNCDSVHTTLSCGSIEPTCPAGEVPAVAGSCWGPCVRATHCAPMSCRAQSDCPRHFACTGELCTPS